MKKYLLGTLAIGGMLFAASCSNEEFDSPSGNDAKVTFTLNVEDGVQTRAISDGKSADKLVYAVFDSEGNQIQTIQQVTKTGVTFPATETITLAKGQKYTVVFWAQDADCAAYNTDNLKNVTVDYNGMNNDETRDAFFKAETFTVTGSTSVSVVMKRPFAQINVGVYQEDWDAAVASGINVTKSSAVITNAATSINLLTGQVSGEAEVTYTPGTIPAKFETPETLDLDLDGNGSKENYVYLSMGYILANDATTGDAKTTLDKLAFAFQPENGNTIEFTDGLTNVPVQRNWRTNIIGKILTGDMTFNISIDPIYVDDYNYPDYVPEVVTVNNANDLKAAIEAGKKVMLANDITVAENTVISVANAVESSLDLNGKTISTNNSRTNTFQYLFDVKDGSTLNVKNGTINFSHTGANMQWNGGTSVFNVTGGGVLNMEDVDVYNLGGTDMNFAVHLNNWGTATLNADRCTLSATYCGVRVFNSGYDMNKVTISNSKLTGASMAFWVHNYINDGAGNNGTQGDATLSIDIFDNNNLFETTKPSVSPIRYGFDIPIYYIQSGDNLYRQGEDYVTFSAYYGDETTIDIPENYNGLPVTALGGYLFNERPVTSVSLPNSLKTIGNRSFRKCTELKSVNLPEGLEIIGTGAFQGSGLTGKVVIPSSVKEIRENAFYEAKNITEINIPEGITTIAKNSFRAIGITEINIPLSVTSIGEYAFRDSKQFATINYGGTKIQWESITKGNGWALIAAQPFCDLTVKCTDGEIIIKRP